MFILTKLEKDGMKRVWDTRLKQRKPRRKSQCAPLVISETYRSRLVFKYVFLFYLLSILLMHKLNNSDTVPDLDMSDEDTSSGSCSDGGEDILESDAELLELEGDVTLAVTETDHTDDGRDAGVQDLEYGGE